MSALEEINASMASLREIYHEWAQEIIIKVSAIMEKSEGVAEEEQVP